MIQVKNAVICDGTGKEPFSGELLIDGEKLAEVSPIPFGELDAEDVYKRQIYSGAFLVKATVCTRFSREKS